MSNRKGMHNKDEDAKEKPDSHGADLGDKDGSLNEKKQCLEIIQECIELVKKVPDTKLPTDILRLVNEDGTVNEDARAKLEEHLMYEKLFDKKEVGIFFKALKELLDNMRNNQQEATEKENRRIKQIEQQKQIDLELGAQNRKHKLLSPQEQKQKEQETKQRKEQKPKEEKEQTEDSDLKDSSERGRKSLKISFGKQKLQLYIPHNETLQADAANLCAYMSIKTETVTDKSKLREDYPLAVVCQLVTRLTADVQTAIEGLKWNTDFLVLVIHYGREEALPTLSSALKLPDELLKGIKCVDVWISPGKKFKRNAMNDTAKEEINAFLTEFYKQ